MVTCHGETWGRSGREIRRRSSYTARVGDSYCYDAFQSEELRQRLSSKDGRTVEVEYNIFRDFGKERSYNVRSVDGFLLNEGQHTGAKISSDLVAKSWGIRVLPHAASTVGETSPLHSLTRQKADSPLHRQPSQEPNQAIPATADSDTSRQSCVTSCKAPTRLFGLLARFGRGARQSAPGSTA